ncbi:hypothetical protein BDW22DRAFT_1177691 [Trametopsis cervina]|nr:hypothetical protein BDW22DRAFT_1177691 [Trametopsis cervina]
MHPRRPCEPRPLSLLLADTVRTDWINRTVRLATYTNDRMRTTEMVPLSLFFWSTSGSKPRGARPEGRRAASTGPSLSPILASMNEPHLYDRDSASHPFVFRFNRFHNGSKPTSARSQRQAGATHWPTLVFLSPISTRRWCRQGSWCDRRSDCAFLELPGTHDADPGGSGRARGTQREPSSNNGPDALLFAARHSRAGLLCTAG